MWRLARPPDSCRHPVTRRSLVLARRVLQHKLNAKDAAGVTVVGGGGASAAPPHAWRPAARVPTTARGEGHQAASSSDAGPPPSE